MILPPDQNLGSAAKHTLLYTAIGRSVFDLQRPVDQGVRTSFHRAGPGRKGDARPSTQSECPAIK
jgi:hypothetical protein